MSETLIPVDIEAAVVQYLTPLLADAYVSTEVPEVVPPKVVQILLTGGQRTNLVNDVFQITISCEDDDKAIASQLGRTAWALMMGADGKTVGGVYIRQTENVGIPQYLPDPDTNRPRYLATVRWHSRPTVA
jgi:hypothetical protein